MLRHAIADRIFVSVLLCALFTGGSRAAAPHGKVEAPDAHAAPKGVVAPKADKHDDVAKPAMAPASDHGAHWGYAGVEGPVHWGHLAPEFQLCSSGRAQSPVDLGFANVSANVAVTTDYKRGPLTILNNGHTIQVNFPEGSTFVSSGKQFNLVQVHFHTPSENTLNGKTFPMEAHFVHRDGAGRLAVLGVFFEEGPTNIELAKVIVAAPNQVGGPNSIEGFTFDPRQLLPADLHVYRLMGSLTTPPCTEGVNWHVAKTPVAASGNQIAALMKLMGNNARPIQPLNDRLLVAPE